MKEKKTIDEKLEDMKMKKDEPEVLNKKITIKELLREFFLDPGVTKYFLIPASLVVLGLVSWGFYSTTLLPGITKNRIEKYKTLQTQVVTLAEDGYYGEADQLSEKLQEKLHNSSTTEFLEIYNDIRRFDDEKIDPFIDFKRLEQLVDEQKWRQADELAQNLLKSLEGKSLEGDRNLLNEYLPNEYESLFDYYQSKIKPTIDDLNEETLIADGKGIYWSNKDNTKRRLILEAPRKVSHVSLSPDKKHVAFSSTTYKIGDSDIYVADIDADINGHKLTKYCIWIKDYPLFWVDNDTIGFKVGTDYNKVGFYVGDIDENNNFYNLREYNPKK